MALTLPVFPLGVVLFPGTALPLHLFEPRYRQLLADVRAGDSRFVILPGMAGIPERELPPGRMACVAEVTEVEMLPDGRSNIMVRGRERVALTDFVPHPALYHVAEFHEIDDEPGDSPVALAVAADDVTQHFRRVVNAVRILGDNTSPPPPLPESPAQLAWTIASMIDFDVEQRYTLLAERRPLARLSQVDAVLRRVLPDLELRAAMHQTTPRT
ncbi:MAG: LON peptidase substrate-binding domain-containing protein [Gemmatimonadaceae bacterium]|nr:LON peptidase substrate-binding domain-containing protein [Gemmatimonadaceae bacterium]